MAQPKAQIHVGNRSFDPSPEQIRLECDRIRAEWSDEEHERRAGRANLPPLALTPTIPGCCGAWRYCCSTP